MHTQFLILAFFWLNACGYTLQNSRNTLHEKKIEKIFVSPVINNSYKEGVEILLHNALVRTFLAHKKATLVHQKYQADAFFQATVQIASYRNNLSTSVSQLGPKNYTPPSTLRTLQFPISTEYMAFLECTFILSRTHFDQKPVWKVTLTRSAPFASANQLDVPGTTSGLINDSEFDRTLTTLTSTMSQDAHESLFSDF